jgi:Fe-S-cluster containining protein
MSTSDWIRQGECNQCGDCCRQATNCLTLLMPIKDEAYGRVRYGAPQTKYVDKSGDPVFLIRGPLYLPCEQLDGDRCRIHETKPQYCREMPSAPDAIEGLPRCSYWFVHRETGEIKGTALEQPPV